MYAFQDDPPTYKSFGFYGLYFCFLVVFLVAHNEQLLNRVHTLLIYYIQEAQVVLTHNWHMDVILVERWVISPLISFLQDSLSLPLNHQILSFLPFSYSLQSILTTMEMRTVLTKVQFLLYVNLRTTVESYPLPYSSLTQNLLLKVLGAWRMSVKLNYLY